MTMYVSRQKWAKEKRGALVKQASLAPGGQVLPAFRLKEAQDGLPAGQLVFVVSTPSVDSDRDRVNVNGGGWDLGEYEKNPLVFWLHNMDFRVPELPIGKAIRTWEKDGILYSAPKFSEKYPFGRMVGEMVEEDMLRMASVGFIPTKYREVNEDERQGPYGPGLDIEEQRLIEWSVVPRGANPDAFAQRSASVEVFAEAKSKGIDIAPYVQLLEQELDARAPGRRAELERDWKALREPRVVKDMGAQAGDQLLGAVQSCTEACVAAARVSTDLLAQVQDVAMPAMTQLREALAANTAVTQAALAARAESEDEQESPPEAPKASDVDVDAVVKNFLQNLSAVTGRTGAQ